MFLLNIRFQIVAVAVMIIIMTDFYRNPRLKLLSTRFFGALCFFTMVNLVCDIFSVYTVTHVRSVSPLLNRTVHQFFIGSVIFLMFINYLYVVVTGSEQRRLKGRSLYLSLIPLVISFFMVLFGRLYYRYDPEHLVAYSYGPMAYMVYGCGIIYFLLILYSSFSSRFSFSKTERRAIRMGLIIWCCGLAVQIPFPQYLLSGTGFVLLMLCIYLTFESQKEYIDHDTGFFNQAAFRRMMPEKYERGGQLLLVDVVLENYSAVFWLDRASRRPAIERIRSLFGENLSKEVYFSENGIFSVFLDGAAELYTLNLGKLAGELANGNPAGRSIKCHVDVIDVRKFSDTIGEVYDLMDFMATRKDERGMLRYLDEKTMAEKTRIEQINRVLENALAHDGFEMYYQPIYWSETGRFQSAEALIRLRKEMSSSYISPDEFILIAEHHGMIVEIGEEELDMVARFIEENNLQHSGLSYIEVNLSAVQAGLPDLEKRLTDICERHHIAPSFINLEVTETAVRDFGGKITDNMTILHNKGFTFSMDDFGTGYSNLSQINTMMYDIVKIDKSLLWPAFYGENEKARALLNLIIKMIKRMNMKIVVEGVETKEMAEYLARQGVEHLQGFYYSKAVPETQFLELLRKEGRETGNGNNDA
jgi:c-di-GMP phosphodiesterase